MERRDGATTRRDRTRRICKKITKPGVLPCSLDRILALIDYTEGLTGETALGTLKTLEILGFIEIDWTVRWVTAGKLGNLGESKDND